MTTVEQLQRLPIDQLDRMAFGVTQGIQELPLHRIRIQYQADYDNALDYVEQHPTAYQDALQPGRQEPVEVALESGVYWLQDGHHLFVTAQVLGHDTILADLTIRDNPVKVLASRMAETGCTLAEAAVQSNQEDQADATTNSTRDQQRDQTASGVRHAAKRRKRRRKRPRRPGSNSPDERSEQRNNLPGGTDDAPGAVVYTLGIDARVEKDLRKLPADVVRAAQEAFQSFTTNPRPAGAEKVKKQKWLHRVHIKSKYRIFYSIYGADLYVEVQHVRLKDKHTYDNLRDPPPPSQRHSSYRDRDAGPQELELERLFAALLPGTEFANKVFAVGGYVRDQLQEREPADLDVAVELPYGAQRFVGFLLETFPGAVLEPEPLTLDYPIWYTRFTQDVEWAGQQYSVAGAELDLTDTLTVEQLGDEATLQFGPVAQDADRRDFTVNMLYRDLTSGELLDPTGTGQRDIEQGLLRARPGSNIVQEFRDQPRRLLRLVRFLVQYGWETADEVEAAAIRAAPALERLSRHDLEKEFGKLQRRGLLQAALPIMEQLEMLGPLSTAWARERET